MGRVLIVAIETVENLNLQELIDKENKEKSEDTRISSVKILASKGGGISVKTVMEMMAVKDIVDISILPFSNESDKLLLVGLSIDYFCIVDDALGAVPDEVVSEYHVAKLLSQEINQKKASTRSAAKSKEAPKRECKGASKDNSTKESANLRPKECGSSKEPSRKKMSFEDALFSRGISAKHAEKLRSVFEGSGEKDGVRSGIMSSLGLDEGGKVLAKLDGSFDKLHELAIAEKSSSECAQ